MNYINLNNSNLFNKKNILKQSSTNSNNSELGHNQDNIQASNVKAKTIGSSNNIVSDFFIGKSNLSNLLSNAKNLTDSNLPNGNHSYAGNVNGKNFNIISNTNGKRSNGYTLIQLQNVYGFSKTIIEKYFTPTTPQFETKIHLTLKNNRLNTLSNMTTYKLKSDCGFKDIQELKAHLNQEFYEYKNNLVLNNFINDTNKKTTNSSDLYKTQNGTTLTNKNYTNYANEIKKASGDEAEALRDEALQKIVKDFSSGNLTVQQMLQVLNAIGITPQNSTSNDVYNYTFKYGDKEYNVTCNKDAAKSSVDNKQVKTYTLDEYNALPEAIRSKYLVATASVNGQATMFRLADGVSESTFETALTATDKNDRDAIVKQFGVSNDKDFFSAKNWSSDDTKSMSKIAGHLAYYLQTNSEAKEMLKGYESVLDTPVILNLIVMNNIENAKSATSEYELIQSSLKDLSKYIDNLKGLDKTSDKVGAEVTSAFAMKMGINANDIENNETCAQLEVFVHTLVSENDVNKFKEEFMKFIQATPKDKLASNFSEALSEYVNKNVDSMTNPLAQLDSSILATEMAKKTSSAVSDILESYSSTFEDLLNKTLEDLKDVNILDEKEFNSKFKTLLKELYQNDDEFFKEDLDDICSSLGLTDKNAVDAATNSILNTITQLTYNGLLESCKEAFNFKSNDELVSKFDGQTFGNITSFVEKMYASSAPTRAKAMSRARSAGNVKSLTSSVFSKAQEVIDRYLNDSGKGLFEQSSVALIHNVYENEMKDPKYNDPRQNKQERVVQVAAAGTYEVIKECCPAIDKFDSAVNKGINTVHETLKWAGVNGGLGEKAVEEINNNGGFVNTIIHDVIESAYKPYEWNDEKELPDYWATHQFIYDQVELTVVNEHEYWVNNEKYDTLEEAQKAVEEKTTPGYTQVLHSWNKNDEGADAIATKMGWVNNIKETTVVASGDTYAERIATVLIQERGYTPEQINKYLEDNADSGKSKVTLMNELMAKENLAYKYDTTTGSAAVIDKDSGEIVASYQSKVQTDNTPQEESYQKGLEGLKDQEVTGISNSSYSTDRSSFEYIDQEAIRISKEHPHLIYINSNGEMYINGKMAGKVDPTKTKAGMYTTDNLKNLADAGMSEAEIESLQQQCDAMTTEELYTYVSNDPCLCQLADKLAIDISDIVKIFESGSCSREQVAETAKMLSTIANNDNFTITVYDGQFEVSSAGANSSSYQEMEQNSFDEMYDSNGNLTGNNDAWEVYEREQIEAWHQENEARRKANKSGVPIKFN